MRAFASLEFQYYHYAVDLKLCPHLQVFSFHVTPFKLLRSVFTPKISSKYFLSHFLEGNFMNMWSNIRIKILLELFKFKSKRWCDVRNGPRNTQEEFLQCPCSRLGVTSALCWCLTFFYRIILISIQLTVLMGSTSICQKNE